jgi:hypothetical protein
MDMDDTARWLDALDEAPDELRELLRDLAVETAPPSENAAAEQLSRILHGVASEVARPELAAAWETRQAASPVRRGLGWLGKSIGIASLIGSAALGWSLLHNAAAPSVSPPPAPSRAPTVRVIPSPPPLAATPSVVPAQAAPPPPAASKKPQRSPALTRPADPGAELELLERAQRAMKADPKAALALLAEHERAFPRGDFVQEREMLAVEALQATGQLHAARQRASNFLRRFPDSSHIPRLELLLHAPPR